MFLWAVTASWGWPASLLCYRGVRVIINYRVSSVKCVLFCIIVFDMCNLNEAVFLPSKSESNHLSLRRGKDVASELKSR